MKGFVYLLTSIETGKGYVGSTKNLVKRLSKHRSEKYNNCSSKLLGPFEHMILEKYIDDDITDKKEFKKQLELVERKWQDLYWSNLVNELRSQVTLEEEREKHKEYNIKHLEKIKEYDAKYRAENPEKFKEYNAKYRAEHRDKINAKKNEKFICECGSEYTHNHKARHIKTKKHQEYLKSLLPL